MKILFIIASLNSGGAERVLTTLANHWSSKHNNVSIFIPSLQKVFYTLDNNINLISSSKKRGIPILNSLQILNDIRQTVKNEQPDIVISFMDKINIITLLASVGLKTPIIISERISYDFLQNKAWRLLRLITYPFSNGMVVLSGYDYQKYNLVKNKKIILNPLDTSSLLPVKITEKENLLIAVGRLVEQKGFDMLIKALSGINLTSWKCYIIGEGPEREKLTALIEQYQLKDNVFLIGNKHNIYDYYSKASVFVLSSHYEGYPNALAEAMAHGCSCVAFDCKTGPSEIIINGENGFLVEAENIEKLQKNIIQIMTNPQIRSQFFETALQIRETNCIDRIAQEWEDYIKSILTKKSLKKEKQ